MRQIVEAINDPEITYPDGAEIIMRRGRLAIVINPRTQTVLTVLLARGNTWSDVEARAVFAGVMNAQSRGGKK